MRPYTKLVSGLLFPIHERIKGHSSVTMRKALEGSQWWGLERLRQHQVERLRALLERADAQVPYFHSMFAEVGLEPRNINSLDDLQRLPLLTKAIIRAHTEDLKASDAKSLTRYNTGGSSGEPLIFYIGKERVSHDVAAKWRATRWWGVDIGDPEIVIWGSPIELGAQDRIRYWRDRLLRTQLLPAFEMSPEKLHGFIRTIRSVRPAMLFGYPSALAHIAAFAEAESEDLKTLGIKVAFVTSESLYDHQRDVIERVFGCPVANGYGGRDAGFIAHQCPKGGMHITAEDIIVEIIGTDDQPVETGEQGEIVVTHLATGDFPFIRYRTGDIGRLSTESCSCGRGLPMFKSIEGRTTDFVVAQDGTVLHGLALIYVLRDLKGISGFKIIQERADLTRVLVVREENYNPNDEAVIIDQFRKRLGSRVKVKVEYPAEIPAEKSGKHRYVISHVQVPGSFLSG